MRFRVFFFIMMALYLFSQWFLGKFLNSLGVSQNLVFLYWISSVLMLSWLNLSFRLGWKRPFRLFPVFFGQFFFSVAIVALVVLDIVLRALFSRSPEGFSSENLRQAWPVVLFGLLFIITVSVFYRLKGPFLRTILIGIPNLPVSMSGLRIVQLSDIHVGGFLFERDLSRLRDLVNSTSPDILVFTGDMIDHSVSEIPRFSRIFGQTSGRYGRYLVMGNHEQWIGGGEVSKSLAREGFSLLENANVHLSINGSALWIVGISDPAGKEISPEGGPNPSLAFSGIPEDSADPVIVLAHQPDVWLGLTRYPMDLMLSGHTHGGQIGWSSSGWNLARLFHRLDIGLFKRVSNGRVQQLFIHGGLGYFGVPVRLGIRPEVVVLTLVPIEPATVSDEPVRPYRITNHIPGDQG